MIRAFGAAVVALLVPLLELERRMRRTGGPGIIPFELAGTPERSRQIMSTWGEEGRSAARLSLLLDFPFLVSYTGLNLAVVGAVGGVLDDRGWQRAAAAAPVVAAAQVAAGACDAVENIALLGVLAGREEQLSAVAKRAATAKFWLLRAGYAYAALGLAARVQVR